MLTLKYCFLVMYKNYLAFRNDNKNKINYIIIKYGLVADLARLLYCLLVFRLLIKTGRKMSYFHGHIYYFSILFVTNEIRLKSISKQCVGVFQ